MNATNTNATKKINEINRNAVNVSKKVANSGNKEIRSNNATIKKNLNKDRNSLKELIRYISVSDHEDAIIARKFFNLKKNANNAERFEVYKFIMQNLKYATKEFAGDKEIILPVKKIKGVYKCKDLTLSDIIDIKKEIELTKNIRHNLAAEVYKIRKHYMSINKYTDIKRNDIITKIEKIKIPKYRTQFVEVETDNKQNQADTQTQTEK